MRKDLSRRIIHCTVCTSAIPEDRLRFGAVTCTKECQGQREQVLRSRRDQKVCRYCMRPSSPAQRGLFARWRKTSKRAAESASLPLLVKALPDIEAYLRAEGKEISAAELSRIFTYLLDSYDAAPEGVVEMSLGDYVEATATQPAMEAASA